MHSYKSDHSKIYSGVYMAGKLNSNNSVFKPVWNMGNLKRKQ